MKAEMKRKLAWGSGALGVVLFGAALIWGPWFFEGQHVRDSKLAPSAGIIVTGLRTAMVALVAGAVAGFGLRYTHKSHELASRQFKLTQDQFGHTREQDREQVRLALDTQVTGLYVEAVKLLGSQNSTERLGGIYALERIMRDSAKDHQTIIEGLAGFVRVEARFIAEPETDAGERRRPGDVVQAAIHVLGRRPDRPEAFRINLRGVDLRGAVLTGCRLDRVDFTGARFEGAELEGVSMKAAILEYSNFSGARLREVDFFDATLIYSNFTGAVTRGVDLRQVKLSDVIFENAVLVYANLSGSKIFGARFNNAEMKHAKLELRQLDSINLDDDQIREIDWDPHPRPPDSLLLD
ncbi:pentapeptide repeat-containing protein [Streptomyces sp. NPDC048527]|uniref:pentapeptide repeat-containing protein n=1 Tax=Streptomyces sp. NPDC048527 TaxID=3365568 RepID=UPI003718DBE4